MANLLLSLKLDDVLGMIGVMVCFLVVVGGYLLLCHLVGKYAKIRGRDYWLFFFVALILNPVIGIIIAAILGETDDFRQAQIRREVKNALEQERNNQQSQNNIDN